MRIISLLKIVLQFRQNYKVHKGWIDFEYSWPYYLNEFRNYDKIPLYPTI